MKITNRAGLSPALVVCMDRILNTYDKGEADFTPTQLVDPVQSVLLQQRYGDVITEDVQDLLHIFQGTLMHMMLEAGAPEGSLAEKRLYCTLTVNGQDVTIGGMPDIVLDYDPDKPGAVIMHQYKYTGARSWMAGVKDEWTMAENIYKYLIEMEGHKVTAMWLNMFFKDWKWYEFVARPLEYPAHAIEKLPIEPWKPDRVELLLEQRIRALLIADILPDDELPECTPEERWHTNDSWAVRKRGGKKASKVFWHQDGGEERACEYAAEMQHKQKAEYLVDLRKGESKRCTRCFARNYCHQYQTSICPAF